MKLKNGQKKPRIDLRYYTVPEGEPVLVLTGSEWVRTYGTEQEDLHFHNLMEIGFCHWGTGAMTLENQIIDYADGTVTAIPSNYLHTTTSTDNSENFWEYIFLDPHEVLQHAFPDNPIFVDSTVRRLSTQGICLTKTAPENKKLASLIQLILDEYTHNGQDYHAAEVQQLTVALILQIARLLPEKSPTPTQAVAGLRQIMPALEYIGKNYMAPVQIADLAAECLLSEAHLRRKFKEYLNMSPSEQLTMVRIKNACDLLNTTSLQMPDVALRVGYQSVSSFERNFQRIVGMSPYQYKKKSKDYKGRILDYKISAKKGWVTREDK